MSHYLYLWVDSLWFWKMFNCNPPIAHCCPILRGWGIQVDHWSTISSWFWYMGRKNKYWYFFCLEIWILAWRSHGKNHGTFFWDFCGNLVRNKLQWNFNRNLSIFIRENAIENFVCEMAAIILSRLQCVNHFDAGWIWNIPGKLGQYSLPEWISCYVCQIVLIDIKC